MRTLVEVAGPWSLGVSRAFWEGFPPAALRDQSGDELRTVFLVERDWTPATALVRPGATAVRVPRPRWQPFRTWASFHLRAAGR